KYLQLSFAFLIFILLAACGAGHKTLVSMKLSPQQATAPSSTNQEVQFSAQGTLSDNSTQELTAVDGLSWSSSDMAIATIGDNTGQATCKAPGTITLTAAAPTG